MSIRFLVIAPALAIVGCTRMPIPTGDIPVAAQPPPPIVAIPPPTDLVDQTAARPLPPKPALPPGEVSTFARCAPCHSLVPGRNMIGPSLAGVFGRRAGSDPRYRYSEALRASGLTWDAATLDRFLTRPRDAVPGNKMTFSGLSDPVQRARVIALIQRF